MDSPKLSFSSKALYVNNGGGNESPMEEGSVDSGETDVVDGVTAAAEINSHHRGSADKQQKFSTLGYQRRTKQKVVTDFATVSKGASSGTRPRAALRQVLFSQGVSDKNPVSEERGHLGLLKQELEAYAVPVSLNWRWKEESQGTTLEKSWTDVVHSHSTMSKMQKHQQEALWEFVHTELTYINKLIIIKDLVIAALVNLRQRGFLLEVTPELLFSNLPSILSAHQLFWEEVIFPMLQEVRRTGKPFDPMRLEAGCLQFHERFPSYQHYCWEEENNLEFTRRQMESNPHFLTYVQWVETHPQCERMRLGDMQAKPHQRITKYPLLLKAILKNTQDPHVQHILRGMMSSVNSFLESINDYLKLKDEQLALSISAQRVEGYEVEGISEEIDRHVREICQFDLTCPIRGVDPKVVRRLLLEENLKIRDRKDNKLEVVALLFSDVLLITKVQKKGERLKVVRPPLALDKTSCVALKDGCSFVLVEVGELRSAMNVYIFAASTSQSCFRWVSAIHQAKETLTSMRKKESDKQMENWKNQQGTKSFHEAKTDTVESKDQDFVDQLSDEFIIANSINGMLTFNKTEAQYQPADDVTTNSGLPFWLSQSSESKSKSMRKSFAGQQQLFREYEWIEMGVRGDQEGNHSEEEEKLTESKMTEEQRMTFNHRAQSAPNLDLFYLSTANDPSIYNLPRPKKFLFGGLPDVDYPTNEESTLPSFHQPTVSREVPELHKVLREGNILTGKNFQSVNLDIRKDSSYSQSGDMDTSSEPWGISKSQALQRPLSVQHSSSLQTLEKISRGPGETLASSNNSSSSYDLRHKRTSVPTGQNSDSHRVLKLGSLKPNQSKFWYTYDRESPDPQAFSEPELPDSNLNGKRHKMKTQRSTSFPDFINEGGHGLHLPPSDLYTLPQEQNTPFSSSGHFPNRHRSPLEGLLERAKERVRERDGLKRGKNLRLASLNPRYHAPSPSFSHTPSPAPSDGERDTEWEEEVELMRHRALTVSKGWKEQLVDGDDDNSRNSVTFTEGVNVDWPGWCFDDDEVMDHLYPREEGLLEGISRSLAFWDFNHFSENEEGECSQV